MADINYRYSLDNIAYIEWQTLTTDTLLTNYIHLMIVVARSEVHSLGTQAAPEFGPHVRHILSWRLGHEKNSTAILPLLLIQEEQLSVTGERMCTKYW